MANVAKKFWLDLTNKKLILVKIINACITGATLSLYPYMTIHLRSLGVTLSEIAVMYAVLPLLSFLGSPIFGFVADRFGHIKIIFSVTLVISAVITNCLLLVPPTNVAPNYPTSYNSSLVFNTGVATINTSDALNCQLIDHFNVSVVKCNCVCNQSPLSTCSKSRLWSICDTDKGALNVTLFPNSSNAVFTSIDLSDGEYQLRDCLECSISCNINFSPKKLCQSPPKEKFGPTFWMYFTIRLMSNIMIAVTNTLNESVCLFVINANGGDYGLLRLWGSVGGAVFAPLSGFLIDLMSAGKDGTYYHAAFFIYGGLKILMAVVSQFAPLQDHLPTKKASKNAKLLFKDIRIIVFLIVMFFTGALWGYLENYLFLFLEELGAKKSLMGLTVTVGNLAGMPFFIVAAPVLQYFGHVNVLCFGLLCYGIRFLGYSLIHDPYWCMPYEVMEAFTMSLLMVAAVTYACHLAPPIVLATMQGMIAAMYYTLGKGTGSLVGGFLLDDHGARKTFQIMAGFSVFLSISYCFLHHVYLKQKSPPSTEQEKEEKPHETSPVTSSTDPKRYGVITTDQVEPKTDCGEWTRI